jgi:hypothetical protein
LLWGGGSVFEHSVLKKIIGAATTLGHRNTIIKEAIKILL